MIINLRDRFAQKFVPKVYTATENKINKSSIHRLAPKYLMDFINIRRHTRYHVKVCHYCHQQKNV